MTWTAISSRLLLPAAVAAIAVTACGGLMLCGTEADATPPAVTPATAPAASPAPAVQPIETPAEAGMRAYIDPETGLITSQPSGVQPVEISSDKEPPVLVPEIRPDGSLLLDLKGTVEDFMVLQLDANGKKVMRCVEDPKAALQTPPATPQREDR